MMALQIVNTILLSLVFIIIMPLMLKGINGIFGMKEELSKINGSIKSLYTWKEDHVKLDDERHGAAEKNWLGLWEAIERIRNMSSKRGIREGD